MNKKILLYSDLHLQLSDSLGVNLMDPDTPWMTTRIKQKLDALDWVVDTAIENKCSDIVDLGDLYTHINPPSKLRNAFARVISRALTNGIKYTRVVGNHETDGREPDGLDVSLLSSDQYKVIYKPELIDGIMYIPEISREEIIAALETCMDNPVFGHFGVSGATYPNGMSEINGIPFNFLEQRTEMMFLGHIHLRQELDLVNYIGALCKHNFSDKNIPTGACLVEWGEKSGPPKDLPQGGVQMTIVNTPTTHKYINRPDIGLHKIEWCEGMAKFDFNQIETVKQSVVKIVCSGSQEWLSTESDTIKDIRKDLLAKGATKVMVEMNPTAQTEVDGIEVSDFNSLDFKGLIEERAKKDKADPEVGLEYLRLAEENV